MSMTRDLTCGKNADDLASMQVSPLGSHWGHCIQHKILHHLQLKQPQVRRCFLDQAILRPGESAAVDFSLPLNGIFSAALLPPVMFSTFKTWF